MSGRKKNNLFYGGGVSEMMELGGGLVKKLATMRLDDIDLK